MKLFAKTGTYAVTHFVVAVGVAYALTQDWRIALGIGLIEPIVQTAAYLLHERVWEKITFFNRNADRQGKQILLPQGQ